MSILCNQLFDGIDSAIVPKTRITGREGVASRTSEVAWFPSSSTDDTGKCLATASFLSCVPIKKMNYLSDEFLPFFTGTFSSTFFWSIYSTPGGIVGSSGFFPRISSEVLRPLRS